MGYWVFISLTNLTIPVMMLMVGYIFLKHAPKNRNAAIGYRSTRSYKSQQTWDFAQQYFARLWKKVGLIMLVLTLVCCLCSLLWEELINLELLIVTIQTVVLLMTIYPVEQALKKNFDENGRSLNDEIEHDNEQEENNVDITQKLSEQNKKLERAEWIFAGIVILIVGILLVTGEIKTTFAEKKLVIESSYWQDMVIDYEKIQSVQLQENWDVGSRVFGLGSFKLEAGDFENEQVGNYTLYSYIHCKNYILIETNSGLVVLNAKNEGETKALYEKIKQKIK